MRFTRFDAGFFGAVVVFVVIVDLIIIGMNGHDTTGMYLGLGFFGCVAVPIALGLA